MSKKNIIFLFGFCSIMLQTQAQTVVWGNANSRTESRNDAGLQGNAGALSGFFETAAPVNYPAGANSWWHLLDVRHSNVTNNYAMQFAGSFFDQQLYFRKTNNNSAQAWSKVLLESNGRVGIGNNTPTEALDVTGNIKTSGGLFLGASGTISAPGRMHITGNEILYVLNSNGMIIGREWGGTGNLTVQGNTVIGSVPSTPGGYKLFVESGILTEKIKVAIKTTGDWSDHVFHKDYPLMPLSELRNFIKTNGHLPGVPSAENVVKNGIDLGKMNAKLLEKVEELTLYMLKQQEEIETLRNEIKTLKK